MTAHRQRIGRDGEQMAVRHLRRKGYKIIERNFRTRSGEIDIIARHKGVTVFIEVKARQSKRYGDAKFAVTKNKQRRLSMAALAYLKRHDGLQTSARFDVVTVQASENAPTIEVFANAFELAYG